MFKKIPFIFLVVVSFAFGEPASGGGFWSLVSFAYAQQQETITITTYYPAPYGVYKELTTTDNTYLATQGGNVGIGTANPGAKLDVAGRIWQTGTGYSVFLGEGAGQGDNLSNNRNVFVGYQAGYSNTTGWDNIALGYYTLYSNIDGNNNTALGNHALYSNTIGEINTAVGNHALYSNTIGYNNVAVGQGTLYHNTTGWGNTALGTGALSSNTAGELNTAVGMSALSLNTTGGRNIAVGDMALYRNTTGYNNVAVGRYPLGHNTTGNNNVAVGRFTLFSNTTGVANVALGADVLYFNTTGSYNIALGANTLYRNTGNGNIAIGYQAGDNLTTGNRNIIIGYDIDAPSATADYQLNIGNIIFGTGLTGTGSTIAGNIGIGTTNPGYKLDVAGQVHATSFPTSSDIRLKENIVHLTASGSVLTKLANLRGVYFDWNNVYKSLGRATKGRQIGLIAQEVEREFPELVSVWGDGSDYRGVDYGRFSAVLLEGVKDLDQRTKGLATTEQGDLTTTGNVGIGTTNPTRPLEVRGNVGSPNYAAIYGENSAYQGAGVWGVATGYQGAGIDGLASGSAWWAGWFAGDVRITGNINPSGKISDLRLKKNIDDLSNVLQKVVQLRGVKYEWNDHPYNKDLPTGKNIGMIAQEVEKQFPELITKGRGDFLGINYEGLIAVLVEAIKEQQKEIDLLKEELKNFKR